MSKLPPLPLIDDCLFMDNSSWIEGMSTCHRSLEYRSLHKRISAGEKPSLNFGSAIHEALEYRYVTQANRTASPTFFNEVSGILSEYFEAHPPPADDWRNLNWAMEVVKQYQAKYALEEWSLLEYTEPIKCMKCDGGLNVIQHQNGKCIWCSGTGTRSTMVELPFALPLHSTTHPLTGAPLRIMYSGRIDLPISMGGEIFVMDHKTTGMFGNMFWDGMRMTSQQRGYVWAFQQITSIPVRGYMINAIRTKEPPQYVLAGKTWKGKSSSTPESWWGESLAREKFYVEPTEIDEWKSNTIDLIEEFLWHYKRDYMPRKTSWCSSYGRCPYYDVCSLQSMDRGLLLASGQFSDNDWSPLNKPTQSKQ